MKIGRRLSVVVAVAAGLAVVVCFPPVFQFLYELNYRLFSAGSGGYVWNDRTQEIAMKRYDSSVSIFQLTTALMAAIWGLIVLGSEKPLQKVASGRPERWTIVFATALLVFSGYYHIKYSDLMIEVQLAAETVVAEPSDSDDVNAGIAQLAFRDILHPMYNASYVGQVTCLLAAAALIAMAITTSLWLTGDQVPQPERPPENDHVPSESETGETEADPLP